MNQYDLCKNIRARIMTKVSEVMIYNWGDSFSLTQVKSIAEDIIKCEGFEKINPNHLTEVEMINLGFGQWDDDNPILLIPLWLYPFLCDEFVAGSISNGIPARIKLSEIDNDHRFGCLSYGVIPK